MKNISRRKFLGDTGKAAVAGTLMISTLNKKNIEMENLFVHHVYFWLKNPGNENDTVLLAQGLKNLSKVTTIKSFHIGKPANTSRDVIDTSYALSWLAFFDNKANQDSYQTDPIHLKFIADCSGLWEKVIVYDSVDI